MLSRGDESPANAEQVAPRSHGHAKRDDERYHRHERSHGKNPPDRDLSDLVGELELNYDRLEVMTDPGITLVVYTAEPGSRSAESFALLASWAATEGEHVSPNDRTGRHAGRDTRWPR